MIGVISYKICHRCDECKSIENFYRSWKTIDGLTYFCIDCIKEKNNIQRHKNIGHSLILARKSSKKGYIKNKEKIKKKQKAYRDNNKEHRKKITKKSYVKNKDKCGARHKKYVDEHNAEINEYSRNWKRERYKNNEKYRMTLLLRSRLRYALQDYSKNGKTKTCLEYGIDFNAIFAHIGTRPGTGKEWHLDHIIPISVFDLDNPEHIRLSHIPENIRWYPGPKNLKKNNSYVKEIFENLILIDILKAIRKYDEAYAFCFGQDNQ